MGSDKKGRFKDIDRQEKKCGARKKREKREILEEKILGHF